MTLPAVAGGRASRNPFGLLLYEFLGKPTRDNISGKRKEREDDGGFSGSDEKGHRSSFRQEGL